MALSPVASRARTKYMSQCGDLDARALEGMPSISMTTVDD